MLARNDYSLMTKLTKALTVEGQAVRDCQVAVVLTTLGQSEGELSTLAGSALGPDATAV